MYPLQNCKYFNATPPEDVNAGGASLTAAIDTLGYDYCEIVVPFGVISADFTVLKVTECDTSGGTYTTVTGCEGGVSTAVSGSTSTVPLAATSDGDIHALYEIDLRSRKRYLKVGFTPGADVALICILAILGRAKESPVGATARGALEILRAS